MINNIKETCLVYLDKTTNEILFDKGVINYKKYLDLVENNLITLNDINNGLSAEQINMLRYRCRISAVDYNLNIISKQQCVTLRGDALMLAKKIN